MNTKILLIDDDQVSLLIAKKYLIISGVQDIVHEILIFDDAADALRLLRELEVKSESSLLCILLDINMPEINGWDFLNSIKNKNLHNHVKVIMLTSSISEEDKNRAASFSSVYGYISKPLDEQKCKEIKQIILGSAKA